MKMMRRRWLPLLGIIFVVGGSLFLGTFLLEQIWPRSTPLLIVDPEDPEATEDLFLDEGKDAPIPLPPGTIRDFELLRKGEGGRWQAGCSSPLPLEEVRTFFQRELVREGWQTLVPMVEQRLYNPEGTGLVYTKGRHRLILAFFPPEETQQGCSFWISIVPKPKGRKTADPTLLPHTEGGILQ